MKQILFLAMMSSMIFLQSCGDDEGTLDLNISGLEDLGADYQYEGWIIVDGSPVSTGVFSVDENGSLSTTSFDVDSEQLDQAATFVLTIEPNPDPSTAPSDVHILAGDISAGSATLSVGHSAAIANDFTSATGKYILATPTDGNDQDELSGLWFLSLESGSPSPGLDLPTLPAGWAYEGWAVINGTPVSTGTFTNPNTVDDAAPFSGSEPGPSYAGEDFLNNAPSGLTFPTDLSGGTAVISIEPVPDNSAAPFLLKPLVGGIPADAADHVTYDMGANLGSLPTGSVSIK